MKDWFGFLIPLVACCWFGWDFFVAIVDLGLDESASCGRFINRFGWFGLAITDLRVSGVDGPMDRGGLLLAIGVAALCIFGGWLMERVELQIDP